MTGKVEVVRFLLERGADVMRPGNEGLKPLQIVRMGCCGGRKDCRIHWLDAKPEIREMIEMAVKERNEEIDESNK